MDIKRYIESGILEEYVLGHKSDAEIEALAHQYPEIQEEIENIEYALEAYAQFHSIKPPKGILEDLLDLTNPENKDNLSE